MRFDCSKASRRLVEVRRLRFDLRNEIRDAIGA